VRIGWLPALIGFILLALLAEINVNQMGLLVLSRVDVHGQMALLIGGIGLVAWGLGGFRRRFTLRFALRLPRIDWRATLPVLGILLLALTARVWHLNTALRIPIDESHMMTAVADLRDFPQTRLLTPFNEFAVNPWIYPYYQARVAAIFGHTLMGLRLAGVFVGTLTVLALYGLARTLFNRRIALVAALLLATFPPHVHFSRLGLINIADSLFATLAFLFAARGLRSGQQGDFALAGIFLGLTQYFYEGGRLLFPALMIVWLAGLALVWRRGRWTTPQLVGLLLLGLVAGLTALPLYYTYLGGGVSVAARLDYFTTVDPVPLNPSRYLEEHLLPPLLHLFSRPDTDPYYYGGATPMLLPYMAALFCLGLMTLLWRLRRDAPGSVLLIVWVVLTLLGASLLRFNSWTARYVMFFPAVMLIAAVGLIRLWERLRLHGRWLWVAALMLAGAQTVYYFGQHVPYHLEQVHRRLERDQYDMIWRALELPPGTEIYLVTASTFYPDDFEAINRFYDMDMNIQHYAWQQVFDPLFPPLDPTRAHAFFTDFKNEMFWETLNPLPPQASPYIADEWQFTLYLVPAEDAR
jgi:hypothetical protein